jgi:hypothetical protein
MSKYRICICFLFFTSRFIFATEPDIAEKYYIQDGERILYLEMSVEEVKTLLGEPIEIKTSRRNDPLHNFDIVTWVYQGLEIVFHDVSIKGGLYESNIVEMIRFPNNGESSYKIGNISPYNKTMEEIKAVFGIPKDYNIKIYNCFTYYNYTIPPLKRNPRAFILQFRFDNNGICDEMFFASDTFF